MVSVFEHHCYHVRKKKKIQKERWVHDSSSSKEEEHTQEDDCPEDDIYNHQRTRWSVARPDFTELLLHSSSWLQVTEHYIEVWEQVERGSTQGARVVSSCHNRAATERSTATSILATVPRSGYLDETTAPTRTASMADLSEGVREAVIKRRKQASILIFTTSEVESGSSDDRAQGVVAEALDIEVR